jgi:hypothetical protein
MSDNANWLSPPPGVVMGCLPRRSKPGALAPFVRDRVTVVPQGEWDAILEDRLTQDVDLNGRADVMAIKWQSSVGSCATEATSQAMEVIGVRCGFDWVELNPWSIYRVTSGGSDRGSNIDDNLEFARTVGVLPTSYFPRYDSAGKVVNRWNARPPAGWEEVAAIHRIHEWWDMTTIDEVGTALLLGYPVVVGWSSHSEVMVDLLPGSKAVVANSWSTEWGDKGFHIEPLSKINWSYGAFAVRTILNRGIV